jgi:Family of unknown function (DUF5995)
MSEPRTIDEVITELNRIIDRAWQERSRIGYFAALYRRVTVKVREGIETGFFADGPRMERLDVHFARRYLEAEAAFSAGRPTTASWQVAFDATERTRPIILQHLVVGINAHINLDLGIAAATTSPGAALRELQGDFDKINDILFALVSLVEEQVAEVSPWLGWLAQAAGKTGTNAIEFSMSVARDEARRFATELAPLPAESWIGPIAARDRVVADLGRLVLSPGWLVNAVNLLIKLRESSDVRRVIEVLAKDTLPLAPMLSRAGR